MAVLLILAGYFSGSVLYARLAAKLFKREEIISSGKDRNPGTANAFLHGGFVCGVFTLFGDILKGFIPVYLYNLLASDLQWGMYLLPLALAAPVIGHAFPVFFGWQGGKGIATTFGCLLGLLPDWRPAAVLAVFFIFFSVAVRISPHFHRTLVSYVGSLLCMLFTVRPEVVAGFGLITAVVCFRMLTSPEKRERLRIRLLWMR